MRNWWGWGTTENMVDAAGLGPLVRETLGFGAEDVEAPLVPRPGSTVRRLWRGGRRLGGGG